MFECGGGGAGLSVRIDEQRNVGHVGLLRDAVGFVAQQRTGGSTELHVEAEVGQRVLAVAEVDRASAGREAQLVR